MITSSHSTFALYELPPTTVVVTAYAPCPVCQRADFNHPRHRSYHVAKCERDAQAADEPELRYREFLKDAAAYGVACAPAPHVYLTVACQGDADLYARNAATATERRAIQGTAWAGEEI